MADDEDRLSGMTTGVVHTSAHGNTAWFDQTVVQSWLFALRSPTENTIALQM